MYDTGSQINLIHPQLAKDMGFKIIDQQLSFATVFGKVLIPQVTEEFKIKVKLIDEGSKKTKWYE